jgi:crotonobetainyl-CoA:carnitine CoA-transferase CaiB-like acyl-CoA transferase
MGDLFNNAHLQARGFFATIDHPATGPLQYPDALYKFSETPWEIRRPAPLLGQHNEELYCGRLGMNHEELVKLKEQRVI